MIRTRKEGREYKAGRGMVESSEKLDSWTIECKVMDDVYNF